MTRHCLIFLAATATAVAAVPAMAQDTPPPPGTQSPEWADPQAPPYPAPDGTPRDRAWHGPHEDGPGRAGAPFIRRLPPEAYPGGPISYPPGVDPRGPMAWGGPGQGYAYRDGCAGPCGCAGNAYPAVIWVPVPVETRYRYSAPIRHETSVVEEKTVEQSAVERKVRPERGKTKYVKPARRTKYTKGKLVRPAK